MRPFFIGALLGLALATEAFAHLTINLTPAHRPVPAEDAPGPAEDRINAILQQFGVEDRSAAFRKMLAGLPKHAQKHPGMLIIKAGSLWSTATVVFPDGTKTQMTHLALVPTPVSANDAALFVTGSPTGGTGYSMFAYSQALAMMPPEVGDPYESLLQRSFFDDADWETPTLLELRVPLSGGALFDVLEARSRLVASNGSGLQTDCQSSNPQPCTPQTVIAPLIAAAYGANALPLSIDSASPLVYALDLGRTYGATSLSDGGAAACGPVFPEDITGTGTDLEFLQSYFSSFALWLMTSTQIEGVDPDDSIRDIMRKTPDLIELALGGVFDPAALWVVDCAARREIVAGETHGLPNILLRSRYYDRAHRFLGDLTQTLEGRGGKEILFFDAASHVTRAMAVGMADVFEIYPATGETFEKILNESLLAWMAKRTGDINTLLVAGIADLAFETGATTVINLVADDDRPIDWGGVRVPDADARALLRDINLLLYVNNRQMLRNVYRALDGHSQASVGLGLPDPAPIGTEDRKLSEGFWFDLRMVLFEQGLVEQDLAQRRDEPGYFALVDKLDVVAKMGTALEAGGAPHRAAWLDRVTYSVVGHLTTSPRFMGFQHHLGPRPNADRRYAMFAPTFDNYWYRISIGSTYAMLLHALADPARLALLCRDPGIDDADRATCNAAVEDLKAARIPTDAEGKLDYSHTDELPPHVAPLRVLMELYMLKRVRQAPKGQGDPTQAELDALDTAQVSSFGSTHDQLALTLAALLREEATHQIYRCVSLAAGITAAPMPKADAIAVMATLSDPSGEHWRTLPDLFDILVGGALTGPPRLGEGGTHDKEICEGIEARYQAVVALMSGLPRPTGPNSSGVQVPLGAGAPTFVAIDSAAATTFRSQSRTLWLHLAYINRTSETPAPTARNAPVQLARAVIAAADGTARMRAKLKVLAAVEADGVPARLGFPDRPTPSALLIDLDGPMMPADADIDLSDGAPSADFDILLQRMGMGPRLKRLIDSRGDVEAYLNGQSPQGTRPWPYPVTPLAHTGRDLETPVAASGQKVGFVLVTERTGTARTPQGDEVDTLSGTLFYRAVVPLGPLAASAVGNDAAASFATNSITPPVVDIPFGITAKDLTRGPNGFEILEIGQRSNLSLRREETRAALASLGLPELFGTGEFVMTAENNNETGGLTIALSASPQVFGIALEPFTVPVWTNGTSVEDFPARVLAAYRVSLQETFEARGSDTLRDILSPLAFSIDLGDDVTLAFEPLLDDSCVRLGQSQGCDATETKPGQGLELSIHAQFELALRRAGETIATITPVLTLLWDGEAPKLIGSDLGEALNAEAMRVFEEELDRAIAPLWVDQDIVGDVTTHIRRGDMGGLQLEVRGVADIGVSCPAPFSFVFDIDSNLSLETVFADPFETLLAGLADTAASCALAQAFETIEQWVDQGFQIGGERLKLSANPEEYNQPVVPIRVSYGATEDVGGLGFEVATQRLVLIEPRSEADKAGLNAIVEAAAISQVNRVLGSKAAIGGLKIERRAAGGISAFGDLVIKDLPYVGDLTLPRIDLAHPDGDQLQQALVDAATNKALELLKEAIPSELEIPFVGKFTREDNGIAITLGNTKELGVTGKLEIFAGIAPTATLRFNLETGAIDVEADVEEVLGQLQSLGPLKEGIDFGPVKITNPRFGTVPGQPNRYAIFFDASITIETLFSLTANNLMLSEQGFRVGPVIGGSIPFPVETGVVSLSSIGVQIYTGEDGGKSGLNLTTDITAVTAALAKLAKIEARLDMRDIDQLAFRLDGDLIVLDSIPLMYSRGEVRLKDAAFDFEAGTVPQIEDIVSARGIASLRGKDNPAKFTSETELSILRVKLSRDELEIVLPSGGPGHIDYASLTNLLIAKGQLQLTSPLDFSNPRLRGGMDLDLFGWSPGGVHIDLDLRRARADVRALFLDVGITVRHADLFDPQVIIDMLLALFDIRLEDLLNIDPENIEIKLGRIGSDGSTGSDGGGGDSGNDGEDGADGGEGSADGDDGGPPPGQGGASDGTDDEPAPENTNPANEGGTYQGVRYCENVYIDANKIARYEFWETDQNVPGRNIFSGHPHTTEEHARSWHNLTFRLSSEGQLPGFCIRQGGQALTAGNVWTTILTKRRFAGRPDSCHHASRTPEPPEIDEWTSRDDAAAAAAGVEPSLVHARSPFMCWSDGQRTFYAWAQILYQKSDRAKAEVLFFCPGVGDIPSSITRLADFEAVCGATARMARGVALAPGDITDITRDDRPYTIITASAEARIIDDLRDDVLNRRGLAETRTYSLTHADVRLRPLIASEPDKGLRVSFVRRTTGQKQTVFLFDGTLSNLLYSMQDVALGTTLLEHWYELRFGQNVRSRPRLIAGPANGAPLVLSRYVVTYKATPSLGDLYWFDPGLEGPPLRIDLLTDPNVQTISTNSGSIWTRLLQLTSHLFDQPNTLGTERLLRLSPFSAFYDRAFLLYGDKELTEDADVWTAGVLKDTSLNGSGDVTALTAAPVTPLVQTTLKRLACQIELSHRNSLGGADDGTRFSIEDIGNLVMVPEGARARYGLSHDPIAALFAPNAETCP